jgi:hypothetical protein
VQFRLGLSFLCRSTTASNWLFLLLDLRSIIILRNHRHAAIDKSFLKLVMLITRCRVLWRQMLAMPVYVGLRANCSIKLRVQSRESSWDRSQPDDPTETRNRAELSAFNRDWHTTTMVCNRIVHEIKDHPAQRQSPIQTVVQS